MVNHDRIRRSLVRRYTRMMMPFRYEWEEPKTCWCGNPVSPGKGKFVYCPNCSTGMLRNRLTEESSRKFYSCGDYRRLVRGYSTVDNDDYERGKRRGYDIISYLHRYDIWPKTITDIGSGAGGVLAAFRLCGINGVGIEPDLRCRKFSKSVGLNVISGESMGGFGGTCDVVILSHILEHLYHPAETLENCGRIGRYVYLETPAWTVEPGSVIRLQIGHLFYSTSRTIELMASRANLEIVAMDDSIRAILRRKHA